MSRIGRQPIAVPADTKVEVREGVFLAEGPKGKVRQPLIDGYSVAIDDGTVTVSRPGDQASHRAKHGLLRALLANAVRGVSEGFEKRLELEGVGYRAELKGQEIHLSLGFSHPVVFPIPKGIEVEVDKQNRIRVAGADRQLVGQVAATLRELRPPDPYKGKGLRYQGEHIRRKAGKAGIK